MFQRDSQRKYEPPIKSIKLRPGMFAQQLQQRHLWSGASEFTAGQIIEVHLNFYTLVFIYVVFLEGMARTDERYRKKQQKQKRYWASEGLDVMNKKHIWFLTVIFSYLFVKTFLRLLNFKMS